MKAIFLKSFYKDIDKLHAQAIKEEVAEVIVKVKSASKLSDIKGLKKLKGYKIAYRIKIGDYRIGLLIEKNEIEFARILHRKDIYKVFP